MKFKFFKPNCYSHKWSTLQCQYFHTLTTIICNGDFKAGFFCCCGGALKWPYVKDAVYRPFHLTLMWSYVCKRLTTLKQSSSIPDLLPLITKFQLLTILIPALVGIKYDMMYQSDLQFLLYTEANE